MRSYVITAVLLVILQLTKAQDTLKRFELGSTLVTVNSLKTEVYFRQDRPSMEYLNGLFFRYNLKKIALRANLSYSSNHMSYKAPKNCRDCENGEVDNKDFRVGVGLQASLLKKKDWVYIFADLSYRNLFSTGTYKGGFAGWGSTFSAASQGLDTFYGLGLRIKTFKRIYVSPEFGYHVYAGRMKSDLKDSFSQKKTKTVSDVVNSGYMAKLHISVRF